VVKGALKSAWRRVAGTLGPQRWRRGPALVVLTYHRVLPEDHPDRRFEQPGMIVSPALLALHLDTLREWFVPIHLDEWLDAAAGGGLEPKRYAAITFDDGWADNYAHALPVLRATGTPATIFVVTDFVGTMRRFWPNRLASVLCAWHPTAGARLEGGVRRRLGEIGVPVDIEGRDMTRDGIDGIIGHAKDARDEELHELCDQLESAAGVAAPVRRDLLDWEELGEMTGTGLVRVGSHTRRHTRLRAGLPRQLVEEEVAGSAASIAERLGPPPALFCYPNGDVSPEAASVVAASYRGALTTTRGWNAPRTNPYALSRIGIHEDAAADRTGFLARLSGWPGV
jgi:peptidoglycan/xylan/chitin deacetylase (PgdA/CDA1 family)